MKNALISYCLTIVIAIVMAACLVSALSHSDLFGAVARVFAQLG